MKRKITSDWAIILNIRKNYELFPLNRVITGRYVIKINIRYLEVYILFYTTYSTFRRFPPLRKYREIPNTKKMTEHRLLEAEVCNIGHIIVSIIPPIFEPCLTPWWTCDFRFNYKAPTNPTTENLLTPLLCPLCSSAVLPFSASGLLVTLTGAVLNCPLYLPSSTPSFNSLHCPYSDSISSFTAKNKAMWYVFKFHFLHLKTITVLPILSGLPISGFKGKDIKHFSKFNSISCAPYPIWSLIC